MGCEEHASSKVSLPKKTYDWKIRVGYRVSNKYFIHYEDDDEDDDEHLNVLLYKFNH
jgi:hypothetical protein